MPDKTSENYRWFLQQKDWELGDFILATPALRLLSSIWNSRVPVFFESPYISEAYKDCSFIEILRERPKCEPFGDNKYQRSLWREHNDPEDVAHCKVLAPGSSVLPIPYIDACIDDTPRGWAIDSSKPIVALFLGCYNNLFEDKKRVPTLIIVELIKQLKRAGVSIVILGTASDRLRYWIDILARYISFDSSVVSFLGCCTLRQTLCALGKCDFFISNDTGLYHAAVAFQKPGLAIWGDTRWNISENYRKRVRYVQRTDSMEKTLNRFDALLKECTQIYA